MIIDNFYTDLDKNNYYLGIVSQVYKSTCVIQTENLSWLQSRRISEELLIPNTINYYVVIDSIKGLFIGEVYQSKISSAENTHSAIKNDDVERILPELSIDVIGIMLRDSFHFMPTGFYAVGLTDKVYIANKKISKKFLDSIEIPRLTQNQSEKKLSSFSKVENMGNHDLNLYPETLFDRHIMTIGTTNSGKSTTALSILDKLLIDNKKILVIDPSGEYVNSFPEENVKKLTLGVDTYLETGKVSYSQWATLFETNDSTQPAVLADAIKSLRYQNKIGSREPYVKGGKYIADVQGDMGSLTKDDLSFDLSLLPIQITEEAVEADKNMKTYTTRSFQFNQKQWLVQKVSYKLTNEKLLNFFSDSKNFKNDGNSFDLLLEVNKFMKDEKNSLYIDASKIGVGEGIGAMIIDLLSNYMINEKEQDQIGYIIFIDEVHRYSKDTHSGGFQTGLTSIAREGRKKGIFLFLTTQNPNDVPDELLGQIGTLIIHRITHRRELESIRNYLTENSYRQVPKLNQGEAILTSINLIRELHLKVDKSSRGHKNNTVIL